MKVYTEQGLEGSRVQSSVSGVMVYYQHINIFTNQEDPLDLCVQMVSLHRHDKSNHRTL